MTTRKRLADGTHRVRTLAATWRAFGAPAILRAAGITRVAELTGLDTLGIPVWAAVRPRGRSLSTSQGKGLTPLAARVSAVMESLETFSAEAAAETCAVRRASYRDLVRRGEPVIDVRALAHPARLRLADPWRWVRGTVVATRAPIWVPLDAVTLDCTFTRPPVFDITSNGLASGNVATEAIVHGLCEVLERDAEAAWRRMGGDRRLVLDTIADPAVRALIDRVVAAGSRIALWDLSRGATPCVIGCAIVEDPREAAWRPLGVYQGFGAHLAPEIAIARAITEAAQTRVTYIAGARDDFFPIDYARATDPELHAGMWETMTSPCDEPVDFADLPATRTDDLAADLAALLALAPAAVAVDLTHPALGVPVVKVLVPGRAADTEVMG